MGETTKLPNPTREAVLLWLKGLDREYVHDTGWVEVNKRFHPLAIAVRGFLQREFPDERDREAAFDGLTLGLLAMAHFDDIRALSELFGEDYAAAHDQEPSSSPVGRTLPPSIAP